MPEALIVPLPAPARAAAAGDEGVVVAAGGRLLSVGPGGTPRWDVPSPDGLSSLAAAAGVVAGALDSGAVVWIDAGSGDALERRPVPGAPSLAAGGGAIWAVDADAGRAWRGIEAGALDGPIDVPGIDRMAPEGRRCWWTSRQDTVLRGGEAAVDLGVPAAERGAIAVCAGAVWISVRDALLRVGAWGGDLAPPLPAPEGPVPFLACAGGVLVGASGRAGLLVLDPAVDADARRVDVDLGGDLIALEATPAAAWAFPAGRAEARVVTLRPAG